MNDSLLIAFALLLIAEGIGPFLIPKNWRRLIIQLSQLSDHQLRRVGGSMVVAGVVMVFMLT